MFILYNVFTHSFERTLGGDYFKSILIWNVFFVQCVHRISCFSLKVWSRSSVKCPRNFNEGEKKDCTCSRSLTLGCFCKCSWKLRIRAVNMATINASKESPFQDKDIKPGNSIKTSVWDKRSARLIGTEKKGTYL